MSEWAPLTLVRGLRGYGKTTEVAVWLESQSLAEVTPVWVSAQPAAEDVQSFEKHLRAALRSAGLRPEGGAGETAPNGLDDLGEALLREPRDRKFVLVIDNFEHVRDQLVLAGLTHLVERHRRLHLVACCQGHHPIELLAAGTTRVNVIEPKELLIGADEIGELARAVGRPIDRARAERLYDAVGGCISMVRMALTSDEDLPLRPAVIEEYVRAQLLTGNGDEVLTGHLMRLALAGPVSWPLFRDLWGGPDPDRLLDDLEATGLMVRSSGAGEVMFTVRDPVGEVLSDQYTSSAPEEAREWHRRLARWLAGHDGRKHVTSAFSHAVAGEDWELMDQLWSENIVAMIAESVQILADNLAAVPADVLRARPSMEVLRDVSRTAAADTDRDGRQATRRVFADASTRVANQQWNTMPLGELLILATGHLIDLRLRGRLQDSAAVGDLVNARVTALAATEQTNKSRSAWFSLHRGLTFSLLNDEFGAVRAYKRAVEYATGSGVEFVPAHAAANLALTYALRGDTVQAQEWLGRHRGFDTADWPGHYVIGIGGHVAAGLLALDRLDYVAVSSELAHLGDGSALFELWPFIAYLHSQHALHAGRAPEALADLDHLRASTDGDDDHDKAGRGVAAVLMWRARADLLIACGRGEKARQLIRAQGANKSWSRVPAARARLLAGHDAAGAGIDPLTWDPATSIRDRLEMLLLGAVGALRCADSRNALRLVNQAFDLYGETGNLRPFAAVPAADRAQLFDLAGQDVRPDDAVLLARQGPVYPDHLALIDLSPHEQSVLEALAQTSSRRAIADSLFVSINTVKTQLAAVYQKLGSTTREEALGKAREHELLPPG